MELRKFCAIWRVCVWTENVRSSSFARPTCLDVAGSMCEFARPLRMAIMSPDTNATSTEINPQLGGNGFGLGTRHVCPFCGTILEKQEGPCPRCALDDTPQTRQSTRSRLGPWYVLQTRNPYAPGMKFSTLLALIRR